MPNGETSMKNEIMQIDTDSVLLLSKNGSAVIVNEDLVKVATELLKIYVKIQDKTEKR
jgi:hypothetical protein